MFPARVTTPLPSLGSVHPGRSRASLPAARPRGFTLLEVLVALAVVAVALAAAAQTASQYGHGGNQLKQRTIAGWVAQNTLAELENEAPWPDTGRREGDTRMAGREWTWRLEIEGTEDPDLRRVDVEVAAANEPDRVVARLTGFLGRRPTRELAESNGDGFGGLEQ